MPSCGAPLGDPQVTSTVAIRRPDKERIFLHFEQLVPVCRPSRNAAECLGEIDVVQCATVDFPPPRELQNEFFAARDLARKRAVRPERIVATLNLVGIPPVTNQLRFALPVDGGA